MAFIQTIEVRTDDPDAVLAHVRSFDSQQGKDAPGYRGARVLSDAERPDVHLIEVEFASREEAQQNSDRSETSEWARGLQELAQGEPAYRNLIERGTTQGG